MKLSSVGLRIGSSVLAVAVVAAAVPFALRELRPTTRMTIDIHTRFGGAKHGVARVPFTIDDHGLIAV